MIQPHGLQDFFRLIDHHDIGGCYKRLDDFTAFRAARIQGHAQLAPPDGHEQCSVARLA